MPPLAALCPPATVIDKTRYSAFAEPGLIEHLRRREADADRLRIGDRCLRARDSAGRG
jgi:isochorismate hydrolase